MRIRSLLMLPLAALLVAAPSWAYDKDDDAAAKAFHKIAELGPGVHAIKTDKKGHITSCVIVGQARISTVLGKAKGLAEARDKARLAASAEFVKWLKEKVSVHQKSEEETILFLEGSEENDKEALKESGKAVEKTSKKMESVSDGLVRGLQVLHTEQSGEDKTYTIILGWSADTAKAVEKIEKGGDSKDKEDKKDDKKIDKKIDDKSATSKDAKKFLPD